MLDDKDCCIEHSEDEGLVTECFLTCLYSGAWDRDVGWNFDMSCKGQWLIIDSSVWTWKYRFVSVKVVDDLVTNKMVIVQATINFKVVALEFTDFNSYLSENRHQMELSRKI